jgi:hypothetical protein
MPSGSEFVCINPSCKHYQEGLSMHDFWPITKIDDVLESEMAKSGKLKEDYLNGIKSLKEEGREYICAPFPRQKDIKMCGIRVQLYCDNPPMIIDQDILCEIPADHSVPLAVIEPDIVRKCEACSSDLLTYRETMAKGVECPYCKQKLDGKVWYTSGG